MAADAYQALPRTTRRRIIFWAVLRGLLNTTLLVAIYYVIPLDQPFGAGAAVRVSLASWSSYAS